MDMRAQIAASGPREAGLRARGWLIVALFFGLILAPAATELAQLGAAPGQENRILAPPPQWVGFRRLRDFTKATDAYIDDHFGLRDRLVHWNSRLRYRLGASSTPKVVIGSDGWLFYAGEKIIEQHTGEDVFTPAELERWVEVMTANRDWLARRGIAFIITIAPDKSTIYPEKLPTYPRPPGRTTRADQLVARLRTTDLVLVDPREALLEAKRSFPKLYFEGDSHWTQRGAFIAYSQLMEAVRAKFPNAAPASLDDYDIAWGPAAASDLAFLLALHGDLRYTAERFTRRSTHQLGTTVRNPTPGGWGWPIKFIETDLKAQPRLLVFGDSFTDYVLGPTFLFESFRDPVFTHHNGGTFNFTLVDEVKPDLVIFALAERYIALPPQVPLGF